MIAMMIRHLGDLPLFPNGFHLYNLAPDTPIFERAIEISRGFTSIFTADEYLQNLLASILSPFFFLFVITIFAWVLYRLIVRYNQTEKTEVLQGQQLLLFKAKQLTLTDYQFKILKGITDILHLEKPSTILDDPKLFERSIIRFLAFAQRMGENKELMASICKDLIITYEKIYHHVDIRKPLGELSELETHTLVGIETFDGKLFVGKIVTQTHGNFVIKVFAGKDEIALLEPGTDLKTFFWRAGDAEYEFSTVLVTCAGEDIEIQIPDEFTRGQSVPHPLVDIILPCKITSSHATAAKGNETIEIEADIFKLNEFEAVIRCGTKLEHSQKSTIEFTIHDFAIRTEVQILRERYISDRKIYYFNLKFADLSEAGKTIISGFITEHLFA